MRPIYIRGFNAVARSPEDFPEEEGECGDLPVRVTKDGDGSVLTCESAWALTPEELLTLANGGHIILRVFGWQSPVALEVASADGGDPPAPPVPEADADPGWVDT